MTAYVPAHHETELPLCNNYDPSIHDRYHKDKKPDRSVYNKLLLKCQNEVCNMFAFLEKQYLHNR